MNINKSLFLKSFYIKLLTIIIICCVGFIIYSNTFSNSFHFDDYLSILSPSGIRNLSNLAGIWSLWPTRFISYLSLAFNYRFNGLNVFGYHLFNLIAHIGCAIMAWWLVRLIFSTPVMKKTKISEHANLFAFFAGLIFLAHPLQTQSVNYIFQRATSLAAFFYLACLCLYAKARFLQAGSGSASKWIIPYVFSWLAALLAMFTKEHAFTLPLMIILFEFCFFQQEGKNKLKYALPFLVLLLIIPTLIFTTKPATYDDVRPLMEQPLPAASGYFFTQARVMVTYLRLLLLPINQNLDYDYPLYKSLLNLPVLASFILLGTIFFIAIKIFRKHRILSFCIFWFFLTLLPESSIFPLQDVIFEHRLYLPMFGFSLILVVILYDLIGRRSQKLFMVALSLLIGAYSFLTYQRNFIWKDEFSLWNDVVYKSPKKDRPYNNRGVSYKAKGNYDQAISDYNKAIELNPKYAGAYNNRGNAYDTKGNQDQAISDYDKAIELNPKYAEAYNNRGNTYDTKGNYDQAISDYDKAIELNPKYTEAYYNRGNTYDNKGNQDQAISDYGKAIELNPNLAEAYNNRAVVYYLKQEYAKAWEDVHKAESLGYPVPDGFVSELKKASGRGK